jgi:catabolic acetolactate synthase
MAGDHQVAEVIVQSLLNAGVQYAFGVPGAKIDSIFNVLLDFPHIHLIVCRHEQNASMMAAAVGRMTGRPGVCLATSGPGASNLATGLLTANTEGDPVVAIVGSVARKMSNHRTHQSLQALQVLGPTCKSHASIDVEDQAAEVILGAFRQAMSLPLGAVVISLPADVGTGKTKFPAFDPSCFNGPIFGGASSSQLQEAKSLIANAKCPVLFLGLRAADPKVVEAVHEFLRLIPMPTVETYQAAGSISKDLEHLYYGRVGLFRNQCGDQLLQRADLVIAIGYDTVEYDADVWNPKGNAQIIDIDYTPADYGFNYQPKVELLGDVVATIDQLRTELQSTNVRNTLLEHAGQNKNLQDELDGWLKLPQSQRFEGKVHPLTLVRELQKRISEDTVVCCDVGTSYIYMMRYFRAYKPRHLLCSNGQQTLGVALPWSISASLIQDPPCSRKVIAIAGDGGFMFSSQELSTAVLQGCNITIFIWNDNHFNMVEFQEDMKYGRSSGIQLGGVDFAKLAESFGAKGFTVTDASHLCEKIDKALAHTGVSLVDIAIDYSEAHLLAENLVKDALS